MSTLILFELNILLRKCQGKSKSSASHTAYLEYSVMMVIYVEFTVLFFIEYMITRKTLVDYTNLFSPNDYKKNDKIIHQYFADKYGKRKRIVYLSGISDYFSISVLTLFVVVPFRFILQVMQYD